VTCPKCPGEPRKSLPQEVKVKYGNDVDRPRAAWDVECLRSYEGWVAGWAGRTALCRPWEECRKLGTIPGDTDAAGDRFIF
jgi:hypothetical protein